MTGIAEQPTTLADLHVCAGLNACKGQGVGGSGDIAGSGTCATAFPHTCSGTNACAGQGGCGWGSAEVQSTPGQNSCKGQGGCGSPIGSGNSPAPFPNCTWENHDGPNKGGSVWQFARKLFEARMTKEGIKFGPSPSCT
ncbi:MAG TPA: hypothetical protein VEW46_10155 [Pyrinomonadaceae bacterium]|nr:hypothetical protein [Pyrinomonadaceae bacterium]